jgi:hypothetical protein
MAVAGGKSGVIYVMNADNLGGFKNGLLLPYSSFELLLIDPGAGSTDAGED